jgi:hypothetical protein
MALTGEQSSMDKTAAIAGAADNGGAFRSAGGTVENDPLRTKADLKFRTAASR